MLTGPQQRLITFLLTSDNQREACKRAGVGEASLYRWLRCREFRRALDEAKQDFMAQSIAELAKLRAAELQPA